MKSKTFEAQARLVTAAVSDALREALPGMIRAELNAAGKTVTLPASEPESPLGRSQSLEAQRLELERMGERAREDLRSRGFVFERGADGGAYLRGMKPLARAPLPPSMPPARRTPARTATSQADTTRRIVEAAKRSQARLQEQCELRLRVESLVNAGLTEALRPYGLALHSSALGFKP
jgi:hypothetical protein